MIRRNAVSVKVKAPSRGLVTRWPSETADACNSSPDNRVWTVAQNVRFEDGVIAAAPGYVRAKLNTPALADMVAHWKMEEASGTRYDSFGLNDLPEALGQINVS